LGFTAILINNSVVAVIEAGKAVVIANSEEGRTIPLVISFGKDVDVES